MTAVRRLGIRGHYGGGGPQPSARLDGEILRLSYAPHPYLFERAAAIVHSGGIGTCANAMRAGRPALIVPFAYDQPDNAARLARLGIARTIGCIDTRHAAPLVRSERCWPNRKSRLMPERVARVI